MQCRRWPSCLNDGYVQPVTISTARYAPFIVDGGLASTSTVLFVETPTVGRRAVHKAGHR
jgi:hypothetical protein